MVRALKKRRWTRRRSEDQWVQPATDRVYKENQPPTITGYEARNSVTVTTV